MERTFQKYDLAFFYFQLYHFLPSFGLIRARTRRYEAPWEFCRKPDEAMHGTLRKNWSECSCQTRMDLRTSTLNLVVIFLAEENAKVFLWTSRSWKVSVDVCSRNILTILSLRFWLTNRGQVSSNCCFCSWYSFSNLSSLLLCSSVRFPCFNLVIYFFSSRLT